MTCVAEAAKQGGDSRRRLCRRLYGARACAAARRRTDVEVELLSEENYFVFQPLLPEVAAGGINPNHVVAPIRDLVPRVRFRWCRVAGVDTARQCVNVLQGEGRALVEVPYDHLVFALGKVSDFSSMPGVSEHSLPLKDLDDAFRLRNHVFRCLELADIESDRGGETGASDIRRRGRRVFRCGDDRRTVGAVAQVHLQFRQYRSAKKCGCISFIRATFCCRRWRRDLARPRSGSCASAASTF
jgi:hypothetical protein